MTDKDYVVQGTVSDLEGNPLAELTVCAFDKDVVSENKLGTPVISDAEGYYRIEYSEEEFRITEKEVGGADLIIRVYDHKDRLLAESKVKNNTGIDETIDIVVASVVKEEMIPVGINPEAFLNPTALFGSMSELKGLGKEEKKLVAKRLNWHIGNEVISRLNPENDKMRIAIIKSVAKIDFQKYTDSEISRVIKEQLLPELKKDKSLSKEIKSMESSLDSGALITVADLVGFDKPLCENPIFKKDLRNFRIFSYVKMANIGDVNAKKLVEKGIDISVGGEMTLDSLVAEGVINEKQKNDLLLLGQLGRLSGDNLALISALKKSAVKSTGELVSWEKNDWEKLIKTNKIPLPPQETAASYAGTLMINIEKSYPTDFFFFRLLGSTSLERHQLIDSVNDLLINNEQLIDTKGVSRIDWKGVTAAKRKKLQQELESLKDFANCYRHLGVVDIINDKNINAEDKKKKINSRLEKLNKFYKNNPGVRLDGIDLFESVRKKTDNYIKNNPDLDEGVVKLLDALKEPIDWKGIGKNDRKLVKNQLLAFQRVMVLGRDMRARQALLEKGYDSAIAIASQKQESFIKNIGLDAGAARMIYQTAIDQSLGTAQLFEIVREASRGDFNQLAVGNIDPSLVNDLREIDGYEDLFGSQNFCACDECRSILSPAAYFVDLMRFIEVNVSNPAFIETGLTNHPLYLKNRRSDLWSLKLTCENTNTLLPYLTVVNEVLETYLSKVVAGDIYHKLSLATENISFSLPFNLHLDTLRVYLQHFETTLYDIYNVLEKPEEIVWQAKLELSTEQRSVIGNADTVNASKRFGEPADLSDFSVQDFIRFANISREQLDELLAVKFHSDIGHIAIYKQPIPGDVQNYREVLHNLNAARLDYIHRFIQLRKRTSWSISELDLLLVNLRDGQHISAALDDDAVLYCARLLDIQEKLKLIPEELYAMVHQLPVVEDYLEPPKPDSDKQIFDRLFDIRKLFGEAPGDIDTDFHHPSFNAANLNDSEIDPKTPLLLAGLGISETDLLLLFRLLHTNIGFDNNGDCVLNRLKISLLYRHAKLARVLRLKLIELIKAVRLNFNADVEVSTPEQILQLKKFSDWLKLSPFAMDDLSFILQGEECVTIKYAINLDKAAKTISEVQSSAEVDKVESLKIHLSGTLNITNSGLLNLLHWVSIAIDGAGIQTALDAPMTNGVPDNPSDLDALISLVQQLERVLLLLERLKGKQVTIEYLTHHKDAMGIGDLKSLNLENLRDLLVYKKLSGVSEEDETSLQILLNNYQSAGSFSTNDMVLMSGLLNQDTLLLESLNASLALPAAAIDALERLMKCSALCKTLGINGHSLQKLGNAADFNALNEASQIIIGAFSAKYESEKNRRETLEPYQDKINVIKRDALCDYIIALQKDFKFKDLGDVYAYFLLDVEMGGCFRTSRVVCAISSLQIYVHRCLVNLEQSDPALNPGIVDVRISPSMIPREEWVWRKNYRVWEANRKVYLYPENYIEPGLRDNKTHIFKELEDELLQEKITKESAEEAYKKYLKQFTELTRLRIAGSYYHSGPPKAVYYLFGRTNIDPYQYYYRSYESVKKLWGNWIKMDLVIEAREISAVIQLNRLYIFWSVVESKEVTKITDGNASSQKYRFRVYVKYSYLGEDGKWAAPQKVYIGYHFFDKKIIYARAWKKVAPAIISDEEQEITIRKFEDIVFRKPYLMRTSSNFNPLELYYIWTHEDSEIIQDYRTQSVSVTIELSFIGIGIKTWAVSMQPYNFRTIDGVIQDGFSLLGLTFVSHPVRIDGVSHTAVLIFSSPMQCALALELPYSIGPVNLIEKYSMSIDVYTVNSNLVKITDHKLSIASNSINRNYSREELRPLIHYSRNLPSILVNEYNVGYKGGEGRGYVQNGSRYFTNEHRIVSQQTISSELEITNPNTGALQEIALSTSYSIVNQLSQKILSEGLQEFLSLNTQNTIKPYWPGYYYDGPYGTYYWEIFFHIPFLIANHLNANQKFEEAKWWYERIFDPNAEEAPGPSAPADRNWRFCKFRDVDIKKMKDILVNQSAIEEYREDPFNPHAIARLRVGAYQKSVVMKYIDNLLDWGDSLFAQDTRESINEAMMLYILANDILGERPVKLGKCESAVDSELNYGRIGPEIDRPGNSEFLIALESLYQTLNLLPGIIISGFDSDAMKEFANDPALKKIFENLSAHTLPESIGAGLEAEALKKLADIPALNKFFENLSASKSVAFQHAMTLQHQRPANDILLDYTQVVQQKIDDNNKLSSMEAVGTIPINPAIAIVSQSVLAFCIPNNKEMHKYWDRVEDRLFKIRNCMNISGIRRPLALFQPPIDPMALVRAKAAGLSMEDILDLMAQPSPHYRFSYLIEKAKQYTQTVQSFGSALLSALEKKDAEELSLLRSVHERNILRMTRKIKKQQIEESKQQFRAIQDTEKNVQNRIDYYQGLIEAGLTGWETTQQISKHTATGLRVAEGVLHMSEGIAALIPDVGSPFAMKYGGTQLSKSFEGFAVWTQTMASIANEISSSAGLEANFQRREQEWRQQLKLAKRELKQVEKQRIATEIRVLISEKDLEIHETSMEQSDELYEFYKDKFTNLGLYNYYSTTLNRLYREAYNMAYVMAINAQKAYDFERNDDIAFVAGDNWQNDRAGLLAGERLLLQLHQMEKAYIEKNERTPEITQSFSLALMDPAALVELKQTGVCAISIPPIAYEVVYPGQYRRLIKTVRLSIPCIVGPYINVGAKLTLDSSEVEDSTGGLTSGIKGISINTSSAQNDSGMFDFNFRDERYLPFEGAGAISNWKLELPSTVRSFNYDTISDVIVHVSYTALEGDRVAAEASLAADFTSYAEDNGLWRIFSLKHEFSSEFHRLMNPEEGNPQSTIVTIGINHFPYLLSGKDLSITETNVYLKPRNSYEVIPPADGILKINGINVVWNSNIDIPNAEGTVEKNKLKGGQVNINDDNPIADWNIDSGVDGLKKDRLDDILILVKYKITV